MSEPTFRHLLKTPEDRQMVRDMNRTEFRRICHAVPVADFNRDWPKIQALKREVKKFYG